MGHMLDIFWALVLLWALAMGAFESCGVCSMGPYVVLVQTLGKAGTRNACSRAVSEQPETALAQAVQ